MKKLKTLILTMVLILTGGVLLACCDKGATITSKELDTSSVDTHVSFFDKLDYSSVTGEIKYSDGNTVALTSENVTASAVDYTTAGEQSVVFKYEDVELKSITVQVETFDLYVDSSSVEKTVETDSAVDLSGLKVWALDAEEGYIQLQKLDEDIQNGYALDLGGLDVSKAAEGVYEITVSYKTFEEKFNIIVSSKINTNLQDEQGNQILFNTMTYNLTGGGVEDLQLFKGEQAAPAESYSLEEVDGVYRLKITENGVYTLKYKKDGADTQKSFRAVDYLTKFNSGTDWDARQQILKDIEDGTSTNKDVDFHEKADYVVGSGNYFYFDLAIVSANGTEVVADDELFEYKLQVKNSNEYQEVEDISTYATVNGEKFHFNATAVGKEFKMSITPKYQDISGVEFEFKVEDGVNVFTHDELVKNFADLSVNKIILQRTIITELKAEQYNVLVNTEEDKTKLVTDFTEEERFASNYNIGMGNVYTITGPEDPLAKEVVTAQERLDAIKPNTQTKKPSYYLVYDKEGNLIHNFTSSPYVRFAYNQKGNNIELNGNLFSVNARGKIPLLDPEKVKAFDEKKYFGESAGSPILPQGKLLSISSDDDNTFAYNDQTAMFDFGLYGGTSSQHSTNLNTAASQVRAALGEDNSGDLSSLAEDSLAKREKFDATEGVKAIFKNINVIGNSEVTSGNMEDPKNQLKASLNSGGLNLIKYKNDVEISNSNFSFGRVGFFASGDSTNDLNINKTNISNMWGDAIYVWQGGLVKLRESTLGASGAPAIWIEDYYLLNGDVFDPYLDIDDSVVIDNYVVGTEPWFSTINGGGALVGKMKTMMDTNVKSLSGNKKTIIDNKIVQDEGSQASYETFNMAIGFWGKYTVDSKTEYGQTKKDPKYLIRYSYNGKEVVRYYTMRQQEDDFRSTSSGFAAVVDEHASSADFNSYITAQATIPGTILTLYQNIQKEQEGTNNPQTLQTLNQQMQAEMAKLEIEGNELAKIVYHAAAAKAGIMQQNQLSDVEKVAFDNLAELNAVGFVNAAVKASMYMSFNAQDKDKGLVEFVVDIGEMTEQAMKGKVLIMTGFEPVKPAN